MIEVTALVFEAFAPSALFAVVDWCSVALSASTMLSFEWCAMLSRSDSLLSVNLPLSRYSTYYIRSLYT